MAVQVNMHAKVVYISTEKLSNVIFQKMLAASCPHSLVHQTFHLVSWLLTEVKPIVHSKYKFLRQIYGFTLLTPFIEATYVLVQLIQLRKLALIHYILILLLDSALSHIWQTAQYVKFNQSNFLSIFKIIKC